MFYVDRVVHFKRSVVRVFPTIHGWTATILRQRQKSEIETGGFGLGFLEDRIKVSDSEVEHSKIVVEDDETNLKSMKKTEGTNTVDSSDAYTAEMISDLSSAASAMSKFLMKLKNAPNDVIQTKRFQAAFEASKFIVPGGEFPNNNQGPAETLSQPSLDDSPEWDECLNNMMDVWEMMQDYPSFSIGLTQMVTKLQF